LAGCVAHRSLHHPLQHCEGANDRRPPGPFPLKIGGEALDDTGSQLRQRKVPEARDDAGLSRDDGDGI
jgi:hypothetical protein